MRLAGLAYYARSIPQLLRGIQPRAQVLRLFLGNTRVAPLTVRVRANGLQYHVRTAMDVWIIKETCLDRHYEHVTPLQDDWTIVDIGAGLGDFTVYAAWRSPRGRVLAFEPDPGSFALLEKNLQLNGTRNAEVRACAVAGTTGKLALNVDSEHATNHSTTAPGTNTIEVPAVTLAQIFDEQRVDRCDFLKMDLEGGEYAILRETDASVLKRVQRIAMEYHDHTPAGKHAELAAILQAQNFRVHVSPSPVHDHIGYLYAVRD